MLWKLFFFKGMMFIQLLYITSLVSCYQLNYFYCETPTEITTYSADSVCNKETLMGESSEEGTRYILQEREVAEMEGVSCSVVMSRFMYRCGLWSHLKVERVPEIQRHVSISVDQCKDAFHYGKLTVPGHIPFGLSVKMNVPIYHLENLVGSLKDDDDEISCVGGVFKDDQSTFTNVVLLAQYHVLLENRTFAVNKAGKVSVEDDHVSLGCHRYDYGCMTGDRTYYWPVLPQDCKMELVQTMTKPVQVESTFLADHDSKILFNISSDPHSIAGCNFNVQNTEYPDIFTTTDQAALNLPTVSGRDVKISISQAMQLSYLSWILQQKLNHQTELWTRKLCQRDKFFPSSQIIHLGANQFGRFQGDVFHLFKCQKKVATIRQEDKCYRDVPIDPTGFVNPTTRIFTKFSSVIFCNARFPLTVRTVQGYVEILPHLKTVATPLSFTDQHQSYHQLTDFSGSGLYTDSEMEEWSHLINFPSYKQAIMTELSLGNCLQQGECDSQIANEGVTNYDIRSLIPVVTSQLDILQRLDRMVKRYGDWIALLCLLIFTTKFMINLIILLMTWRQGGAAAAAAILTRACCPTRSSYKKMLARTKNSNKYHAREDTDHYEPTEARYHHHLEVFHFFANNLPVCPLFWSSR